MNKSLGLVIILIFYLFNFLNLIRFFLFKLKKIWFVYLENNFLFYLSNNYHRKMDLIQFGVLYSSTFKIGFGHQVN
jgi:hypothetical protein